MSGQSNHLSLACSMHANRHIFFSLNTIYVQLHNKLRHQHSKKAKWCSTQDFLPLTPCSVAESCKGTAQSFKKNQTTLILLQRVILKKSKPINYVKWLWGSWLKSSIEIPVSRLSAYIGYHNTCATTDLPWKAITKLHMKRKRIINKLVAMQKNRSLELLISAFFVSKCRLCQQGISSGTWNSTLVPLWVPATTSTSASGYVAVYHLPFAVQTVFFSCKEPVHVDSCHKLSAEIEGFCFRE